MYILEFELNGLPSTINAIGRKHWAVKVRENTELWSMVHQAVRNQKPDQPLKRAVLKLTRYSSTSPDADNLAGSFKAVVDALVKEGILENDKMANIGFPNYKWEYAKRGQGKIKVRIEGCL